MLPFDQSEFFELFERYNEAIWPLQLLAYVLGAVAAFATFLSHRIAGPIALGALAALWGWTGVAYHWVFFASINPIAPLFAAAFVGQALVLAVMAARARLQFAAKGGRTSVAGWLFIAYAAVLYPVLNAWLGHPYPSGPSFGVTPCPLVIFTLGIFLLSRWRIAWIAFIVPCLWSIVGGSAAVLLGVWPDLALPIAALLAVALNAGKPQTTRTLDNAS